MSKQTTYLALALAGLLGSAIASAQTQAPPQSTTSPSSASTPAQRDSTRSPAAEAPPSPGTQPADASTPHQREAMASHDQTIKACMDRQARDKPGMSKSDMTKACDAQMKSHKDTTPTTPTPR